MAPLRACSAPGCAAAGRGVRHACQVCGKLHCQDCCKRYLSLEAAPSRQVLACNSCFLGNVIWDAKRTHDVYGPQGGRPVVLVHGALIGRACMALEARALASAGYRVLVPDLPGHGARFAEVPLTLENAVETLHELVCKEAPGQKVVMLGLSMGGFVTAAYAAAHPGHVAGVVLGACAHDAHTRAWRLMGHVSELVYRLCSYKTKSGFIYNSSKVLDPARPEVQECFMRAGAEFDSWRYVWRLMHDADMRRLLPRVACPALLAVGERDFRSHEALFMSLLRNGRLLVLPGAPHEFAFAPGACEAFREEVARICAAAEWGVPSEQPPAPAPGPDAAAPGVTTTPEGVGVGPLPPPPPPGRSGGAARVDGGGVGVWAVVTNLWAQRRGRGSG